MLSGRLVVSDQYLDTNEVCDRVLSLVPDATVGLPEPVFHLVSQLTPLVNVDLLIQREKAGETQTLLTWRSDDFYKGWHLPGGILRFKEAPVDRVHKVAARELLTSVLDAQGPLIVSHMVSDVRDVRGHFIALLYQVELATEPSKELQFEPNNGSPDPDPRPGQWMWHSSPPDTLLSQHDVYRPYI